MKETETRVWSLVRKIPWSRKWQPASVFLPGKFHGQRSLVSYSPWSYTESDRRVVYLLSYVWLFATLWAAAHQASLSITSSQSLLKLMSIELVMPFNHLILCHPLLLLPSIFPSIKVFSNESTLSICCPKCWSFSFSISPSNEYLDWFPLGVTGLILLSKGLSRVFFNTTAQKHQFFRAQPSLWSNFHIYTWLLEKP